ncbi:MAG: cysteine desulfurase NifS [Sarcina sp.]
MERTIYMDHAATTYVKPEVLEEMIPYFTEKFGNPSSFYEISRGNQSAIATARDRVAKALNCHSSEVYFTNGGSESDNWAIKGIANAYKKKGNHIITSKIEHHAVLHTCEYLEKNGFEVTYLDVDDKGFVRIEDLKAAIKDTTILVSIMFANNEIGTIEPIKEIGTICREKKIIFHTDAVQAVGNVKVDVKEMNIDLLSLSGHKFYGPKGIGALYIRKGVRIDNLIHGGSQERARRAGTENTPAIVGLGKAIELAVDNLEENSKRISMLRDKLIKGLTERIPHTMLNGPEGDKRLPGNVNVCFEFIEGEGILLSLDFEGICASSGSACTSGSLDPSHVLLSIGRPHEVAHGSLRLSLGDATTEEDVDYVINTLEPIIARLRSMSPLWKNYLKEKGDK